MFLMANNHISLAIASDQEISALGFVSVEEAVQQYSCAASHGFKPCRFVPFGLQSCVEGVLDDDYVLVVTGVVRLNANIGTFGARPSNIRGWILFSNCNYFLESFDMTFGHRGGDVVYVDQYMCDSTGAPALQESEWEYTDYFGDQEEIDYHGITFVKAWHVERLAVPYQKQTITAITSIQWCGTVPHTLNDGVTTAVAQPPKRSKNVVLADAYAVLYDQIGSPFMTNGSKLRECIVKPVFLHALVQCKCGNTHWTVGDWSCFKSLCCGLVCKPKCTVSGDVVPGDVVLTSQSVCSGVKYYNGMILKFIEKRDGVSVWRVIRVQAVDGFVASSTFDPWEHSQPLCSTGFDSCNFDNMSSVAVGFKFGVLSGVFDSDVKAAVATGLYDVGNCICDVIDDILTKPSFVRRLEELVGGAWEIFVNAVKVVGCRASDFIKLVKSFSTAVFSVVNGAIHFEMDVPECFASAYSAFRDFVLTLFELSVKTVNVAGVKLRAVGDYVLFNNAIVKFVTTKVKGFRQQGINSVEYATVVFGPTQRVESSRVEVSNASLVVVDEATPLVTRGVTCVIGGRAFFHSGGCYRLMADNDAVLETPVFRSLCTLTPVFDCPKPEGFPDIVATDVAELCVKVEDALKEFSTPYRTFTVNVYDELCVVNHVLVFETPGVVVDSVKFCELCKCSYLKPGFDLFYREALAVTDVSNFPSFEGFECFLCPPCPDLLVQIDDGGIWKTFVASLSNAFDFCKSLKISFGLDGVVISTVKRFKKVAAALTTAYNTFVSSVKSVVYIAGVSFVHYAFTTPMIMLGGCLHAIRRVTTSDLSILVEDGLDEFDVFDDCVVPVIPSRVETRVLELEETDYVEPRGNGFLTVVNGYTFYSDGTYFYPSNIDAVVPLCYRKVGGGKLQFNEDVKVCEISPVYKVKLDFEFEDDNIVTVCKKSLGKSLKFDGTTWEDFCVVIDTAMSVVAQHMSVPKYYIYDEEGGTDFEKTVMISQWPLESETEVGADVVSTDVENSDSGFGDSDNSDVASDDTASVEVTSDVESVEIVTDAEEVAQALSFIEEKPSTFVPNPFAYEFLELNGIKILKQDSNNCWVASACVQLQLLDVLEDTAFDLFKVGRVGPFVQRCYEVTGSIKGSLGDVAYCMEQLLKDYHTLQLACDVNCDCGSSVVEMSGCVFRFMPTAEPFPYGLCAVCGQVLVHKITRMQGTGVFCQEPVDCPLDRLLVEPICASVYSGSLSGGHYRTNVYPQKLCVDGVGPRKIKSSVFNTVCVKDVDFVVSAPVVELVAPVVPVEPVVETVVSTAITPFAVYKNVEFYQGELKDLLALKHDFVVNAANEKLQHGGGVAKAINDFTGGKLQTESNRFIAANGPVKVGSGVMLVCGDMHILNVVGPRKGKHASELLVKAYANLFSNAGVALTPLLSVGIFKVPIEDSLSALFAVAGDRVVRCFCYTDTERQCIIKYVQGLEPTVEPKIVSPVMSVEAPLEPFRVEGRTAFYRCDIKGLAALKPDRVVVFTNETLTFCHVASAFDKFVDGAIIACVKEFMKSTPKVPAGNIVTFKCEDVVTFVMAVLPSDDDKSYDKNLSRTLNKLQKLKGKVFMTVPTLEVFKKLLDTCNASFIVGDDTSVIDACFSVESTVIKVTSDGRDVQDAVVSGKETIDAQLGPCTAENKDLTGVLPNDGIKTVVSVAPPVDWRSFYGFDGCEIFHTLDHSNYAFDNEEVDNRRVLKFSDNNCWVNATCLQLQYAKAVFKHDGLQDMWVHYLVGDVEKFCHWLYWLNDCQKGSPGDVENTLNLVSKYLVTKCTVTLLRTTSDNCCPTRQCVNSSVVNASVLKLGYEDGVCAHGLKYVHRVESVNGSAIIVNVGKPKAFTQDALLSAVSYTGYVGSLDRGHYTVYDSETKKVHDGAEYVPGDLSALPVTSLVVRNKVFQDPVSRVERKAMNILNNLDAASENFFSIGDVISRNVITTLVWLFSMLSIVFKACRKKDFKVFALAPERTGVILSRSLRYNAKAVYHVATTKSRWVLLFLKLLLLLYTVYACMFLFVRFGPVNDYVCSDYVSGYTESNFDKNAFCSSPLCKACLYGYQELADFPHTNMVWEHLHDPLIDSVLPMCYLAFLAIFGGYVVRAMCLYFVAQYVNLFGSSFGLQDNVWLLQVVPFSVFGDEIVVCFVVFKILVFVRHVLFGCDKASCVACCRSARLERVPMQTIVNGATKSFYVTANGGKKFCNKHNFFCLNCDSYGVGNTFINEAIAKEVSNVVKTSVVPTGASMIQIDKVGFSNGFYYLYSGETFWKYNFDVTEAKYSCKEVLKNCNVVADFIVYNNNGSNVTQVRNACVYFSQLLCKPIKLVDSALLSSLNVDFNGSLHAAFVEVLTDSFSKDLSSCTTMADCKQVLGLDVSDEDFVNAVSNAHRYNVLLSDLAFNNFATSYAKPEEKLSTHDIATCMRSGAKVVNHNVLVKENMPVVWSAREFDLLSEEGRKYLVKTSKLKGVNFMLTFNENRMQTNVPVVSIAVKRGSGVIPDYTKLWWFCGLILGLFFCVGLFNFSETVVSASDFDFKYILNGKLNAIDTPLNCVHNVFENFEVWHEAKFGSVPTYSRKCPIVVGVNDDVRTIPGVPAGVMLVGKTLVFAVKSVFADSSFCFDMSGPTNGDRCVFNSACTVLSGLGGVVTYCYKHGLVEGSKLYADLLPNSHYKLPDGNFVKLPETLARGFGFRTIRTLATTYCRVGQCIDSKAGVCFGADRFFVYGSEVGPDYICGTGLFSLLYNVVSIFSSSFSVMAMSGQIMLNFSIAAFVVSICFLVTKFKRVFGDLSYGVFSVCATTAVNNISYIVTQNVFGMYFYAFLYIMATRSLKYAWIWHCGFVIAYSTMAPWWLVSWYVVAASVGLLPSLLKLKVSTTLFEGDKFVGTFESAAAGTFVMDMHSYQRLVNSIAPDKLKQYAASYNKYKYYSGGASEADYRLACFAHLAKAMLDYGSNHQDMLYTPPTVSYNSTLQSGLRKMAQPSGIVEKCVVRVSYGNMTLNGLWLGDTVICPRHVIASSTTTTIDYEHEASVMRLHNFSISVGSMFLGVVGVTMHGCNLRIKVNQSNVNTPKYVFKTIKPGDSFNILACYDGTPAGVYGVNLRTNNTVRGSFINGACGSPGYNLVNGVVEFVYLHQLELGSGCHVGSNIDGVMYGGFEDQPTLQVEGSSNLVTVNVIAFLYGALLNGVNWWLTQERVTSDAYNEWAVQNGFTTVSTLDCFTILAAKTGVDVNRVLAAVQRLQKGFGGKSILGFTSLSDEFTVTEVVQQMYGVTLQSTKVGSAFKNLFLVGGFFTMLWSELMMFTPFFWVSPGFVTPIFMILVSMSVFFTGFLKHKMLFFYTFLLPGVVVTSFTNFMWELEIYSWLTTVLDYHVSIVSIDMQGVINIIVCVIVALLHTMRFASAGFKTYVTYVFSLLVVLYNWWFHSDVLSLVMMLILNVSDSWFVGAAMYRVALWITACFPAAAIVIGNAKFVIFVYIVLGFLCCMYYGVLYWLNRFCKLTLGVYDFKVSANEFKYMVANGLRAPYGVFDSLLLSLKLVGIGGEKCIKVSTIQSKLTDIKCTNVVLLGCLSSMNIAANTKEWAHCVELHNKINLCDDPEQAQEMLLALLAFFISKQKDFGLDDLIESYFDSASVLQSVASTFVSMPSYIAYENARQSYEDAVSNGSSPQLVKQLKRAMNIAKAEFDHEASVQKKINRMAEQAAAQMFKEARAVNRKSKIISAMHSLLFSMLRRLDMSSVDTILNLAKDGVVPLSVIPATCATKLSIVSSDIESFAKIVKDGCVHYAGVVWSIADIADADGKAVHLKEVTVENAENITWPLFINCVRVVKLQNNEIIPGKLKQRVVKAEGDGFSVEGKALFNNEGGKTFMYAFVADKPDLKFVKWEFDGGCNTIELEPPCRFAVESPNGPIIKYLYFVRNLNTLRRGAVLGFIGATVRLQAGKQTELASNSPLLTMCAFAVDPAKTYVDAVKKGVKPVGNCVKMLSNGSGTGQAITVGVEANTNQESYGGASVCLYCRAHVEHPTMDGACRFRGKYVQVPIGTPDPIRFCLENEPCKVCMCWLNNGCTCDRTVVQSCDQSYLNRARGSSAARLEPCNGTDTDHVVRAFDVYNKDVACIGKFLKVNCVRLKNLDSHDAFFVIKRCTKSVMEHEQSIYDRLKQSGAVAAHDFFLWKDGRSVYGNVSRQNLTKYTMMDLCFALRNFDERNCETLKEILILKGCCDESYFDNKYWFDPVENEDIHKVYAHLGQVVANAMLKCVRMCDAMIEQGIVGVLTLDNQDLNGDFYDFGDFVTTIPGMGVPLCTSYYSYMMPIMGMTNCLASECFMKSDIFGSDFKTYDLLAYDFTDHKVALFNKYFKHWGQDYHPNCSECYDELCVVHCANFNTLFSTTIPNTAFGPLCRKVFVDGVPLVSTAGYHFKQLGLVWNKDINTHSTRLSVNELLQFVTDPALLVASSPALVDQRTICFSVAALSTGMTNQTVKPGHFNKEFYDFLRSQGFFEEGSELTLKHFFFAQKGDAAVRDFDYYRYNRPTVLDICQARVTYKIVQRYFEVYEGGCIAAKDVVVTNLNKSAGYPLNKFGKAGLYYDSLSYEEQDALYAITKRNVLPTMTQLNLKYAISGKERARTVGGVSLLSTMTTRQFHQKHLKSIVNTRNASVVIGTTKFYGGWDNMLKNLIDGVDNACLMGWDYPKCDRALPNMIRMISAMILGSKHVTCCDSSDRYYRLCNELAQVLTEVVYSNGGFYLKPGGTTSGDATTAYANSVFNIFQAVSANINKLLSIDSNVCNNVGVKALQRQLYDCCYRSSSVDDSFVDHYYCYLRKHFSMMILSDDGVVCYNKDYADLGYVADINAFKATLYYQNNVFMSTSKCWVEPDINKGPHEFCSQHTMQIVDSDGKYYLPYPDPSRILSAGVFVDDIVKTDAVILLERYVSLAIDAYPLSKHENPEYRKVFYVLLDWVKHLHNTLNQGVLESFSVTLLEDASSKFWDESFYAGLYEKSTALQAAGLCVVCSSQTVLRCGDCLRRPMLCTKCAYDHVVSTNHKFILAITPYVCNASGCSVNDVTKLYLGGLSYWCIDHKPSLSFPLCSAGNVFGLYKNSATGSPDVEVFNTLATSDWTDVKDYKLANDVKDSLRLFAAETVKAKEESVKSSYACATLKEVIGPRELILSWECGKIKPPLNRNSVFTCFQITKDSKFQVGEFTFEKLDYGSDAVCFKSTATVKLVPGMIFVLTSHNVQPLRAPTLANQERYASIYKLHPTFNISDAYSNLVPYYQMIGKQRITTIQGPPGSGKSHCVIGLGLYYPGARMVFAACSHAAVDSLCVKAASAYSVDKCTRIIPARARVECYSGFKANNTQAQYIFSTVNALPESNVDIVVIDEVSMCTNYDLSVINQRLSYKHIVYVGDPQQLPAPRTMITKGVLEPRDYNVVTQRMCAVGPDVFLHKCYRCPAEIVRTVSEMVYENKFVPVHADSKQCFKLLCKGNVQVDNGSSINRRQLDVVKMFLAKNPKWSKAVFISPYNSQNYVASRALGLQIQTVDSSQGSEYEYVIYTQTSDTAHACNVNRFNVAITRAKKGILCVMCDKELFDALKFFEIKLTDLQAGDCCGLFKDCYRRDEDLPPSHASTYVALSDKFKVSGDLAAQIGFTGVCRYEHVISFMGFRFDINVPDFHSLFCTRDFAMRNVRGWLGMDVEGAHVVGDNVGTNVPLQVGFSNGVDFVVQPEGCVVTETGSKIVPVRARAPPGEQFTHLVPLLRKGQPWTVVRKRIVQMCCDYLSNLSDIVIFVLWAGGLELTTMRYFVKIGPAKVCDCGKVATCYNSVTHAFYCFRHALGCDYLYNPYVIDIQQWDYKGSLSQNHHEHCNVHRNEHVASGDAIMTRCLAIYDCFVKNVDWSITYPFISNEHAINKSGRVVQSMVMKSALKLYKPKAIHDIGNPKGIRCAVTDAHWYCYDKQPLNSNVKLLEYDYITHGQMDGLCLFWNCNVDMYPEFSVVCRFDTRYRSNLNLEGVNGGSLYVNNHAFHTPAFDRRAMAKLKPMPFFFYDDTPCDRVQEQVNYVPLRASNCVTKCNIGGAVCSKHASMYHAYVNSYNTFTQAGFTIWVPSSFDLFNLWQTFADVNLQGLENIAFNVLKKGSFVGAEGELPVAIVNDKVLVREGTVDNLVFTNKTSLPTNVAFELFAKRKVGLTPPLAVLRNLGVVSTYKFVLWDYEADRPFTTFTKDVCKYTDFGEDVCTCYDNSIQGSFERFTVAVNAVLISNVAIKKLSGIRLNYGLLNGVPVAKTDDKPVSWYIYARKNGQFVEQLDGYFTQGRNSNDFLPRSTMESDFLDMDMGLFIAKYGLEDFAFEHIVYGDVSSTTLGGLHLLISQVRLSKMGVLKIDEFTTSDDSTLKSCTVTYANDPSSKMVCTYMDLLLDDFVTILKSLDLSVVSKVHEVIVDCKMWRWMLWCKDHKVQTFYPQLQSSEWKCGYSMPALYKIQRMCLEPCNLYNYGASLKLPDGIMFNVVKYTQLCQYLNCTTMCVPHNMRVLHLGAGSDKGVAPGTAVLRRWLPSDAIIVDNDVNDYVSDADFSVTGDCSTLYLQDKFDLVISDMYDGKIKQCDGANVSKDGFFTYVNGVITEKLSLGGTVAIKITEYSWNKRLYELIQKFEFWTLFCTSVNTSSSEAFLIGVNYLGDNSLTPIIDGNTMHANYIFWRNSTIMSMSYNSVLDLAKFSCKHKATVVVALKENDLSDVILGLIRNGKLLVRKNGVVCGYGNHLVSTK
ncbi:polyprotein 1ab [alphacoronavirus sp. WA3607]|uniref:ORF1ab polyprotein n=2 Tax=Alphacoronavirus TaxID=693996 RepID=A0AA48UFJ9_9ALPC|nr:polyprotein 1ab [Alphacoronavirus sp.]QGX41950.1 polyprotein 1ab [alphacoronavirus sp. WA3607]